jgi:hypothetical protein
LGDETLFKSGEIFVSLADAIPTATRIQITRNFLIPCSPSERGALDAMLLRGVTGKI